MRLNTKSEQEKIRLNATNCTLTESMYELSFGIVYNMNRRRVVLCVNQNNGCDIENNKINIRDYKIISITLYLETFK